MIVSVVSPKGGVGKSTLCVNLAGFAANAGLNVLMIDLDEQSSLSGYYRLAHAAPKGIWEVIFEFAQAREEIVSQTCYERLDLIYSDDRCRNMATPLLHEPDGRLRLRKQLPALAEQYDLILIDTPGARSVVVEMAILASDMVVSPIMPEMLAARELQRGTVKLIERLKTYWEMGIPKPPLRVVFNRVPAVSSNAELVEQAVRLEVKDSAGVEALQSFIPALEAFQRASSEGVPVHRHERRRPRRRVSAAAIDVFRELACELFPAKDWHRLFWNVTGKEPFERTQGGKSC
jgi:chromosome partitioning related protein ParA